jgi:hypothetical protein
MLDGPQNLQTLCMGSIKLHVELILLQVFDPICCRKCVLSRGEDSFDDIKREKTGMHDCSAQKAGK